LGFGSVNSGKRPLSHGNVPASTMTPPMVVPCPPIHFVALAVTMSAPCSIGLHRKPAAPNVLSTTSGTPWAWAMSAIRSKSGMLKRGLPIVSK
jgi:hypothetical protein